MYNLYLNYLYNDDEKYKKLFTDLFDYNIIEKDLVMFLDTMKKDKNEIDKSLDMKDLENFDRKYAHVCYLAYYITTHLEIDCSYTKYLNSVDEIDGLLYNCKSDEDQIYEIISKYNVCPYVDKDVNFWIKGFGKYKDI